VLFGIVGLLWGYVIQQFSQTVYILGAGLLLAAIVSESFTQLIQQILIEITINFLNEKHSVKTSKDYYFKVSNFFGFGYEKIVKMV